MVYYLVLLIGVIGLGLSGIFVKYTNAPSEIIAFYRLLFTFVLTLPLLLKTKLVDWQVIKTKDIGLIALSAMGLCFYFTTWFISLDYTSVASSTVLVNIHPILVILITYLIWKKGLTPWSLGSVLLTLLGMVILNYGDFSLGQEHLKGNLWAMAGAGFFTLHLFCTAHLRKKLEIVPYTLLLYAFGTIIMLLWVLLSGAALSGYSGQDYLMFLLLALVSTLLGQTLLSWCLKYLPTTLVSLSSLGEPVVAAILAYFLFQEKLNLWQVIGCLLVMGGIALYTRFRPEQTED